MVHIDTDNVMLMNLARKLANLLADELACQRGLKVKDIAAARVLGACEVAYVLGYGNTPTHVDLDVRDWVRNNPRPVDVSAFRKAMKEWTLKTELEVASILQAIYRD